MKRRILSIALALAILCTMLPQLSMDVSAHTIVMTANEFIECLQIAISRPNVYNNVYPYNLGYYDGSRISWDCWNLGKSIIWSKGSIVNNYATGTHARVDTSCGLGDWDGLTIVRQAPNCGDDFSNLVPGEWLYMVYDGDPHTGYYVGNGQVIECTPAWGVNGITYSQIDSSGNRSKDGVYIGKWLYHGMVPWIDYTDVTHVKNRYPSSGTIKITDSSAYVKSMPCSQESDPNSRTIEPATKNDTYDVIGLVQNTFGNGNYWYKVEAKVGGIGYVYSGDATFTGHDYGSVTISGVSAPSGIVQGNSFSIKGLVKSSKLPLLLVGGYVTSGTSPNATLHLRSEDTAISGKEYQLYNSPVDIGLKFGNLGVGNYTYTVGAAVYSYSADRNELSSPSVKNFQTVYTRTFTVSNTSDSIPTANCDDVIGQEGGVYIRGWAFDADTPNESVTMHVYIDGVFAGECTANVSRPDVNSAYGCGDYHGFSATIPYSVSSTGTHSVEIFALNTTIGKDAYGMGPYSVTISGHTHSYVGSVTSQPSCSATGVRTYTCSGCGASYTEAIPATGYHSWGAWGVVQEATCTTTGTRSRKCYVCWEDEFEDIPAKGHTYREGYCKECGVRDPSYLLICLDVNGGEVEFENEMVCRGNSYILPLTVPDRFGYNFQGWRSSVNGVTYQPGNEVVVNEDVVFTAQWEIGPKYSQFSGGIIEVPINYPGKGYYIQFVPTVSDYYLLKGESPSVDTCATLYDAYGNVLKYDDDGADELQFWVEYDFEAGETYWLYIESYSDSFTGTIDVGNFAANCLLYFDSNDESNTVYGGSFHFPWVGAKPYPYYDIEKEGDTLLGWSLYSDAVTPDFLPWDTIYIGETDEDEIILYAVWFKDPTQGTCGENLTWSLTGDGVLTISGTGTMTDYSFNGRAPWYDYRDLIYEVVIQDGVTTIGDYAFELCRNLWDIEIPNSVTSIGNGAFDSCRNLEEIVIPDSVTTIGNIAFQDCDGLQEINIPRSVTVIKDLAFVNSDNLTGIWVDEDNPNYCNDSRGVLFNKDQTVLIQAPAKLSGSYSIPTSVTTLGNAAFSKCRSLSEITIPNSVTTIGFDVFSMCSGLSSVIIPGSVIFIDSRAFGACIGLTSVTIPGSVGSISSGLFHNCSNLAEVIIGEGIQAIGDEAFFWCSSLESITLPNSVISIGEGAFGRCFSLTSVTFGDSVTSIGTGAFKLCSDLTDVYYGGTATQWSEVAIGEDNDPLLNATLHVQEEPAPSIELTNVAASFDSAMTFNFVATKASLDQFEDVYVEFTADGKETERVEGQLFTREGVQYYAFGFTQLNIRDLGLTVYATIHGTYNGQPVIGETKNYSLLKYCTYAINGNSDDALPCAYLLKYAQAAEEFKNVAANERLDVTALESKMATIFAANSDIEAAEPARNTAHTSGTQIAFAGQNVDMATRISMIYYLDLRSYTGDNEKVTVTVDYTDGVTGQPAQKTYQFSELVANSAEGFYEVHFGEHLLTQMNDEITCTVYIDGVFETSYQNAIGHYCYTTVNNANSSDAEKTLAMSIYRYGAACAKAYN